MLTIDCIKEIAYRSDYKTIKILIDLYPKIRAIEVWKTKCWLEFPDQNYLDFYTGEENYLLRKIGNFVLPLDFSCSKDPCGNHFYQYSEMLKDFLDLSFDKFERGYLLHNLIHINLQNRFVILYAMDLYHDIIIIDQCSIKGEAINIIKKDIKDICLNERSNHLYMIIDMKSVIPYFWKYGKLRQEIKPIFQIYKCSEFL